MTQNPHDELLMFEEQILKRLHSAQRRFQTARDEQMKRYYKGQVDALSVALHEMRIAKFEAGAELSEINIQIAPEQLFVFETPPAAQNLSEPTHEIVGIPEEEGAIAPKKRGRKKKQVEELVEELVEESIEIPKKRGRKPATPPTPKTIYQTLAREAIDLKVLSRRASWFYHELLPKKIVKGLYQLEKTLEENTAFREAIQAACAEKKAFVPAEETVAEETVTVVEQEKMTSADNAVTFVEPQAVVPAEESVTSIEQDEIVRPKKRGRKPATPPAPKVSEFQQLAREAVDLGVFPRKASWFYHKLLPQGLIKGLYQLEKALEHDVTLREAIQAACAEKKAFVPAAEVVTVFEPNTEPFQEAA